VHVAAIAPQGMHLTHWINLKRLLGALRQAMRIDEEMAESRECYGLFQRKNPSYAGKTC
jgi:hypothetical protein